MKSTHFIPVRVSYSVNHYAKLYLKEIVRLHGVSLSIITDRGTQFTSQFWKSFQKCLSTRVKLITAFNPQTDGYHSSIGMAPFEVLYGRRCRSPIGWFELGEFALIGPELVHEAIEKVWLIRGRLETAQSRQNSYVDVWRRYLEFEVDDWVYLKILPIKGVMRFGKKEKLSPIYVGPYQILRRIGKVAYELELPNELALVHPVFHVSLLKKYVGDLTSIVPLEGLGVNENHSYEEVPVEILDRQVKK
ncbi:hypothetical protein MTR67_002376 [Solanum verrucosum]|uniref:Tf2-1-like SH3-like domain-containing protein n=1 Tax=Solanum verrucosum TaxID=315347 RepID=A0AAF0T8C8_SOLVR|nr:hypothetical protein MTR67_002376 [Solanum verrucosum]